MPVYHKNGSACQVPAHCPETYHEECQIIQSELVGIVLPTNEIGEPFHAQTLLVTPQQLALLNRGVPVYSTGTILIPPGVSDIEPPVEGNPVITRLNMEVERLRVELAIALAEQGKGVGPSPEWWYDRNACCWLWGVDPNGITSGLCSMVELGPEEGWTWANYSTLCPGEVRSRLDHGTAPTAWMGMVLANTARLTAQPPEQPVTP